MLLAELGQPGLDRTCNLAREKVLKRCLRAGSIEADFPGLVCFSAALCDRCPVGLDLRRNDEWSIAPADVPAGVFNFGIPKRRAMGLVRTFEVGGTFADPSFARNQTRLARLARAFNRTGGLLEIVTVDFMNVPACGPESGWLVG